MSTPSTPTWYDLLDVDPSASTDEVRAAWKAAVADLDPTDRRFQRLSDAAAVLLDPERRAAYDAEVGVAATAEPPAGPAVAPVTAERVEPSETPETPETLEPSEISERRPPRAPRTVPLWVLGVLAVVALVLVPLAAYSWTRPDPDGIERDADTARAAAERAVVPVLSYDYRTLAAGQRAAEARMTTRYRDKAYRPLFATIEKNAPSTRTVVTTKVVESAIVRAQQDRVQVLVLVDRPTTNAKQTTPVTYEDHVTVTMERSGGEWLVDDMST